MDINDKVAIITGATSGIGLSTARLFSRKGIKVVLVGRTKSVLDDLSIELPNSLSIVADMANVQQIQDMVSKTKKHFGKIDILVNNAGRGYDAIVEHIDRETFKKIIDLDLLGPISAMQQVIPHMREQGEGVIINVSSGTALMILPGMGAYASLKQALAKISLTARVELAKDNIKVSVIYPYITDTDFEKNTIKQEVDNDDWEGDGPPQPADSPDFVAEKILEGIKHNAAEIFVHDWMKR